MAARIQADKNISAPMFKRMLISGAKMLDVNKATVDALNVFPVPDGDWVTISLATATIANDIVTQSKDTVPYNI